MKNYLDSDQNNLESLITSISCSEPPWTLTRPLIIWNMLNYKKDVTNSLIYKNLFLNILYPSIPTIK